MASPNLSEKSRQGAEDSAQYFRYMAEFIGFTAEDAEIIKRTRPVIEKYLPDIVSKFYSHLLRYPPTRKFFLKADGTLDKEYLELRMRHLTNFWLRSADGFFDEEYARYVDYVGRAHTSRGADPSIYIPERYVIGQMGFVQHAITKALVEELHPVDEALGHAAEDAWAKLMMVLLEMLARAYGNEREAETFDPLVKVDEGFVDSLAELAFDLEQGPIGQGPVKEVVVAKVSEIPEGERKIVYVDGVSIGVFHHNGNWYALRNSCLHRGAPVATGSLKGDILTCPWHGFQYDVTTGRMLVDPNARLDMYAVQIEGDEVHLLFPVSRLAMPAQEPALQTNEFWIAELLPGQKKYIEVDGQGVVVCNIGGKFYAIQSACTHAGGPLDQGTLDGEILTCPIHRARFDVTTGQVVGPPARRSLKTYQVTVSDKVGRVEKS
jgi:nitrite reductase/ring-hydroxylating ferredoxin subunit/hemoglobin-like flavoprotein